MDTNTPAPGTCGQGSKIMFRNFEAITKLVAASFKVSDCVLTLVDPPMVSMTGSTPSVPPWAKALCSHIVESGQMLVVEDILQDPGLAAWMHTPDAGGIRFYAGVPLRGAQANLIGVLCIMHGQARQFASAEREWLTELASLVVQDMAMRQAVARVDPVSGLPNRHQLADDIALAPQEIPAPRIMAHLEIPRAETGFEIVTTFGVEVYEDILRKIALVISETFHAHADVYHFGAGQFVLVSRGESESFIDILHGGFDILQSRLKSRQVPLRLHGYGGYVEFAAHEKPAEVYRKALSAAHVACARNQIWAAYDRQEDAMAQRSFRLIQDFPEAIEQNHLRLVFQPKLDLIREELSSAEALVRWHHPDLGDISPSEFIPLIEKTRLIRPFSDWVMTTAISQLGLWTRIGLLTSLAINLSGKNFLETDLAERIANLCKLHRVAPDTLEIECTESILMADQKALQMLASVRSLGPHIAIDDFGTGYSNIAYLQNIPATSLKLDRSLIEHIVANPRERAVLESLLQMARNLGYQVVVEGVETQQQFDLLSAMQVDVLQGYFISHPLEREQFEQFVSDYQRHIHTARAGVMPAPRRLQDRMRQPVA
ncbi:EAL domain-containing protein [Herbaspirillum huttiense]|uniref:sensor domain-containing protein n=1 Tax=Herbaspirillum huttiense TaxID=863372 RepID=UPI0039B087CD